MQHSVQNRVQDCLGDLHWTPGYFVSQNCSYLQIHFYWYHLIQTQVLCLYCVIQSFRHPNSCVTSCNWRTDSYRQPHWRLSSKSCHLHRRRTVLWWIQRPFHWTIRCSQTLSVWWSPVGSHLASPPVLWWVRYHSWTCSSALCCPNPGWWWSTLLWTQPPEARWAWWSRVCRKWDGAWCLPPSKRVQR